ncbi:LOW QUALITY PROTEIN: 2'-5'-oligoadenylate synthase 1 [Molossus nigricans]
MFRAKSKHQNVENSGARFDWDEIAPPFPGNETNGSADSGNRKDRLILASGHWLSCPCPNITHHGAPNCPSRGGGLDKFIKVHLLSDEYFRTQVKEAIAIIYFLKERCFRQSALSPVHVSKVGGSSGKGTTVRGRPGADLVVFLTLQSFREQFDHREDFIREIKKQLRACQKEKRLTVYSEIPNNRNPRALSFKLKSSCLQKEVGFDVLPAYDVRGPVSVMGDYRPDPQVCVRLIQECKSLGQEGKFPSCFSELRRTFLEQRPAPEPPPPCQAPEEEEKRLRPLSNQNQTRVEPGPEPTSVRIHAPASTRVSEHFPSTASARGSLGSPCRLSIERTDFITAQGFQSVWELVLNYQKLCIYTKPVILDPADPAGNLADGELGGWQRLAQEARVWLSYPCSNQDGSPVGSWKIQVYGSSHSRPRGHFDVAYKQHCCSFTMWIIHLCVF